MAASFNSSGNRTGTTGNITVPSTTNGMFILFVAIRATAAPSYAPTLNSVALTAFGNSPASATGISLFAFWMPQASLPAAGARALNIGETGGSGLASRLVSWAFVEGVAQSAPEYAEVNNQSSTTTMSVGAFNVTNEGIAVAAAIDNAGGGDYTYSANWTEMYDVDGSAGDSHGAGAYRLYAGSGTDTLVFTSSGTISQGCASAISIAPIGGGGGSIGRSRLIGGKLVGGILVSRAA